MYRRPRSNDHNLFICKVYEYMSIGCGISVHLKFLKVQTRNLFKVWSIAINKDKFRITEAFWTRCSLV